MCADTTADASDPATPTAPHRPAVARGPLRTQTPGAAPRRATGPDPVAVHRAPTPEGTHDHTRGGDPHSNTEEK